MVKSDFVNAIGRFFASRELHIALVVAVVILGAFLRLFVLVYPPSPEHWPQLQHSDYNQDFLVAYHAVKYGEIPWNGPGGLLGTRWVSPMYFYTLSAFLLIYPDIKFLSFANMILQVLSLIGVYALARILFGRHVGLIALALFAFSNGVIWQSHFNWQPYLMQPFSILSYILLALGYKRGRRGLIYCSIVVFLFAMTMHYSMVALAPTFSLLVLASLRSMGATKREYMQSAGLALFTAVTLHLPPILYFLDPRNAGYISLVTRKAAVLLEKSFSSIAANTLDWWYTLFNFFLGRPMLYDVFVFSAPLVHAAVIVVTGAAVVYFWKARRDENYYFMASLAFALTTFCLMAGILISREFAFRSWYLTPIMSLWVIFVAYLIYKVGEGRSWAVPLRVATVLCLMYLIFIPRSAWRQNIAPENLRAMIEKTPGIFTMEKGVSNGDPMVKAIADKVRVLAESEDNLYFFDFKTYWNERVGFGEFGAEPFWVPLESEFGVPLVRVDGLRESDFAPIAQDPKYNFLTCIYDEVIDDDSECLSVYTERVPSYEVVEQVYTSPQRRVYLARQRELN